MIRVLVTPVVFVNGLTFRNHGHRCCDVVEICTLQFSFPVERLVKSEQLRAKFQSQVEPVSFAVLRILLQQRGRVIESLERCDLHLTIKWCESGQRLFRPCIVCPAVLFIDRPNLFRTLVVHLQKFCSVQNRNFVGLRHEIDETQPLLISDLDVASLLLCLLRGLVLIVVTHFTLHHHH